MGTAQKKAMRTPSAAAASRPKSTRAGYGSTTAKSGAAKRPAAKRPAAKNGSRSAVNDNVAWVQAFLAGDPVEGGRAWERVPSADGTSSTLVQLTVAEVSRRVAAAAAAGALAEPDAAAIRQQSGLSQARFAAVLDVPVATLRNWEQKRRAPRGPARQLLRVAAAAPEVLRILQAEGAGA